MNYIEIQVDIFKKNRKEFTGVEADRFVDELKEFILSKGLEYGGGHELKTKV